MNYFKSIDKYIQKWKNRGYSSGLPDKAPERLETLNKVGSYRLICLSILQNDLHLTKIGMSRPKSKAYSDIKKEEIRMRNHD